MPAVKGPRAVNCGRRVSFPAEVSGILGNLAGWSTLISAVSWVTVFTLEDFLRLEPATLSSVSPCRPLHSEIVGRSFRRVVDLDSRRAVLLGDVTEPALRGAGHSSCRRVRRQPGDERSQLLDEFPVYPAGRRADVLPVRIDDVAPELHLSIFRQRPGEGVLVDHDLHGVVGAGLGALGVNDHGVVARLLPHQRMLPKF